MDRAEPCRRRCRIHCGCCDTRAVVHRGVLVTDSVRGLSSAFTCASVAISTIEIETGVCVTTRWFGQRSVTRFREESRGPLVSAAERSTTIARQTTRPQIIEMVFAAGSRSRPDPTIGRESNEFLRYFELAPRGCKRRRPCPWIPLGCSVCRGRAKADVRWGRDLIRAPQGDPKPERAHAETGGPTRAGRGPIPGPNPESRRRLGSLPNAW